MMRSITFQQHLSINFNLRLIKEGTMCIEWDMIFQCYPIEYIVSRVSCLTPLL